MPVFLISLKAGGTGLTLTRADTVIHYDPWWNPAVENQATDRAHRIGQDKTVFVYKLIAEGTVEEKMVELQGKKQALVDWSVRYCRGPQLHRVGHQGPVRSIARLGAGHPPPLPPPPPPPHPTGAEAPSRRCGCCRPCSCCCGARASSARVWACPTRSR